MTDIPRRSNGRKEHKMKRLTLTIETGNDAMRTRSQVAAAMTAAAKSFRSGKTDGAIMDANGNKVGCYSLTDDMEQDLRVVEMLWDYLKRDPEHKDRRQTAWGTKTSIGLADSLRRMLVRGE